MQNSILMQIQETIAQYADVISKITQAQVEIMDKNYIRIAGTGRYAHGAGKEMKNTSEICQHIFNTGTSIVIDKPTEDPLCQNCPSRDACFEKLSIYSPIFYRSEIEGVIALVAVTEDEKKILQEKLAAYQDFIEKIADFISIKAKEYNANNINRMYTDTLAKVVDNIDNCVITLHEDNTIKSINSSTRKHLNLTDACIGSALALKTTGDGLHGETEYKMNVKGKDFYIVGQLHEMYVGTQSSVKILIFMEEKQLRASMYELTSDLEAKGVDDIIGNSLSTQKLKQNISRVAKSMSTILITGESGTGKELVAQAIWKKSPRKNEIFVPINCAAIPDTLLESELFGYVKGAFSGANPNGRIGKFELANHGTLFLDEIGDMPIYLQSKLLRVLQDQKLTRIGSNNQISIDTRIICATNKDLKKLIRENKFREDLYYRLNVIPIQTTPLRERPTDIPDLIHHFINKYRYKFDKYFSHIEQSTLNMLMHYNWPGNVRELENAIEYMINMMNDDGNLNNSTLPDNIIYGPPAEDSIDHDASPIRTLKDLERTEIERAISLYGNTTEGKKAAAKKLGIAVSTLYRKLENNE